MATNRDTIEWAKERIGEMVGRQPTSGQEFQLGLIRDVDEDERQVTFETVKNQPYSGETEKTRDLRVQEGRDRGFFDPRPEVQQAGEPGTFAVGQDDTLFEATAGGMGGVKLQEEVADLSSTPFDRGDFIVRRNEIEDARGTHNARSKEAQNADEGKRAPITTNDERYATAPGRWDYPGVDTPTQEPKALPKDYKRGGEFSTTEVDEETEVATGSPSGFAAHPEAAAGGSMKDAFMAEMAGRDVPASPEEVTRGVGLGMPSAPGGQAFNAREGRPMEVDRMDQEQAPPDAALRRQQRKEGKGIKSGDTGAGDIAFIYENEDTGGVSLAEFRRRVKRKKREMAGAADDWAAARLAADDLRSQNETDRVELDLPDETLSQLRTGLNERTDDYFDAFEPNNQEQLESIRERISIGDSIALSPAEFQTAKRILKDERDNAEELADEMGKNIFGDTSDQAEFANEAFRGLINNPPR